MTIPPDIQKTAASVYAQLGRGADADEQAIAKALMAERSRCAAIADAYAEVNWEQCTDSILLDPVLSNKGERPLTQEDWARSEDMSIDGTIHSSMYHAATNIAAAIRTPHPSPTAGAQ